MNQKLSDLTFNNIDIWPMQVKIITCIAIVVFILFMGYLFDIKFMLDKLQSAQQQEIQLKSLLEIKQQETASLKIYQIQLSSIKKNFSALVQVLPTRTEVPGLLDDISKTGLANGLEFSLFKPLAEKQKDFYTELPLEISVIGNYHQLAKFISQISALGRIVTLHDFSLQPIANSTGGVLRLDIHARTYRYTETNRMEVVK
ncbi:type 4a pilus biogenesis protein PilO [soil metagenome]